MLSPILCAKWDGCSVWLQWDQPEGVDGVFIRIRMRPGKSGDLMERKEIQRMDWSPWRNITNHKKKRGWLPIAVHRNRWDVQVEVSSDGENWEAAAPAEFRRARCRFRISAASYPSKISSGVYSAVVDGAVCSYSLEREFLLLGPTDVEMVAESITPWSHIDKAGDFRAVVGGDEMVNISPSEGGIEYEGSEFATIDALVQAAVPIRVLRK